VLFGSCPTGDSHGGSDIDILLIVDDVTHTVTDDTTAAYQQVVSKYSLKAIDFDLEVGERAKRDDKLVTIMDVESLYAVAQVRESEAVRLSSGMKARVRVDATGTEYDGTLSLVSPVADSQTASFMVRVAIRDPEARLKPGMFARIVVAAGEPRRVAVIPEGAIAERAEDSGTVFVVANGMVAERHVELGEAVETGRIVLAGVADGDVVVDRPKPELREGDRVAISK